MTLTEWEAGRPWASRVTQPALRMRGFRIHDVIAEIKPHTPTGISEGVRQLRRRAQELAKAGKKPGSFRFHLITYRQLDQDPSRYETYVSDPRTMESVMDGSADRPQFLRMSDRPLHLPRATERIAVHECPTMLGNELEGRIRARYAAWMRLTQGKRIRLDPKPSPQQGGADLSHRRQHELVAFLRELAAELETELETERQAGPLSGLTAGGHGDAAGWHGR